MLAISSCWNSHRHTDGGSMLCEMAELGFEWVEISHGTSVTLFPNLIKALNIPNPPARVCGVHNFCPSPVEILIDAPDAYEFTSRRVEDRARATKLTLKSIDTAVLLGGSYVVLHLGSARVKGRTRELEQMAREGQLHSRKYIRQKLALISDREKASAAALRQVREALEVIVPYAREKGIRLGIESRSHYEQIPDEHEMRALLAEFADDAGTIGYWHDFGHTQRRANLGFINHRDWVGGVASRWIGAHLHDCVWPAGDHQIPFQGAIDFDALVPMVPVDRPLVWEISPRFRSTHIKESLAAWKSRYPQFAPSALA